MSKVLDATCDDSGQVTCEGFLIPEAKVLSEGKQASEGKLFIEGEKVDYLASSASDIKTTLEKISVALEKISSALDTLGSAGFLIGAQAGVPWSGTIAPEISAIDDVKSEVDALKDALK